MNSTEKKFLLMFMSLTTVSSVAFANAAMVGMSSTDPMGSTVTSDSSKNDLTRTLINSGFSYNSSTKVSARGVSTVYLDNYWNKANTLHPFVLDNNTHIGVQSTSFEKGFDLQNRSTYAPNLGTESTSSVADNHSKSLSNTDYNTASASSLTTGSFRTTPVISPKAIASVSSSSSAVIGSISSIPDSLWEADSTTNDKAESLNNSVYVWNPNNKNWATFSTEGKRTVPAAVKPFMSITALTARTLGTKLPENSRLATTANTDSIVLAQGLNAGITDLSTGSHVSASTDLASAPAPIVDSIFGVKLDSSNYVPQTAQTNTNTNTLEISNGHNVDFSKVNVDSLVHAGYNSQSLLKTGMGNLVIKGTNDDIKKLAKVTGIKVMGGGVYINVANHQEQFNNSSHQYVIDAGSTLGLSFKNSFTKKIDFITPVSGDGVLAIEANPDQVIRIKSTRFTANFININKGLVNFDIGAGPHNNHLVLPYFMGEGDVEFSNSSLTNDNFELSFNTLSHLDKLSGNLVLVDKSIVSFNLNNGALKTIGLKSKAGANTVVKNLNNSNLTLTKLTEYHGTIQNNLSTNDHAGIVLKGNDALHSDATVIGNHGNVYLDTASSNTKDTIESCLSISGDTVTKLGKSTLDLTKGKINQVTKFNVDEGSVVLSGKTQIGSGTTYLLQDKAALNFTGNDNVDFKTTTIQGDGVLNVNLKSGSYLNVTAANLHAKELNIDSGIVGIHLSTSGGVTPTYTINNSGKTDNRAGVLLVSTPVSGTASQNANHFVANDTVLANYSGNLYTGNNIVLDLNLSKTLNPINFVSTKVTTAQIRNENTKALSFNNLGSFFGTVVADKGDVILDGISAINTNAKLVANNGHSITLHTLKLKTVNTVPGVVDLHIDSNVISKTGDGSLSLSNAHFTNLTNFNVNEGLVAFTTNIDDQKSIAFNLGENTDTYLISNSTDLDFTKHSFSGTGNLVLNQQNNHNISVTLNKITTTGKVTILGTVKSSLDGVSNLSPNFNLAGTGTLDLVPTSSSHVDHNIEVSNLDKFKAFTGTIELNSHTNLDFNGANLNVSGFSIGAAKGAINTSITNSNSTNLTLNDLSKFHGSIIAKNGDIVLNQVGSLQAETDLRGTAGQNHNFYLNVENSTDVQSVTNLNVHSANLVKIGDGLLSLETPYFNALNNFTVQAGTLQLTNNTFHLDPFKFNLSDKGILGFNTTGTTELVKLDYTDTLITGNGKVYVDLKSGDSLTLDLANLHQTGDLDLHNGNIHAYLGSNTQDLNFKLTGNSNFSLELNPVDTSKDLHTLVITDVNKINGYNGSFHLTNNTEVTFNDQKTDLDLVGVKFTSNTGDNSIIHNLNSKKLTINDLSGFNGRVISDNGDLVLSGEKAFNTKATIKANNGHEILLETQQSLAKAYQTSIGLNLEASHVRKIGEGNLALDQANFKGIDNFSIDTGDLIFTSEATFDKDVNFNLGQNTNLVFQAQGDLDFSHIKTFGTGNIVVNQGLGHKVLLNLENLQHSGNLTINQGFVDATLGQKTNHLNFNLVGKGNLNLSADNKFVKTDGANTLLIDQTNALNNFTGSILVGNNSTLDLNLPNYRVNTQFISEVNSNANIRNLSSTTLTFSDLSKYSGNINAVNGDVTLDGIKALSTKATINTENNHNVNLLVDEHKNYLVDSLTVNSYQINKIGVGTITFNNTHFNNLLTLNLEQGGVVINQNLFTSNIGTYKLGANTALGLALNTNNNEFQGHVVGTGSVILIRDAKAKSEQFNSNVIVDTNQHNLVLSVRNSNSIPILVGKGNVFTTAGIEDFASNGDVADGSFGYNDPNKNVIVSHSKTSSLDDISIGTSIDSDTSNFDSSKVESISDIESRNIANSNSDIFGSNSVISGSNSVISGSNSIVSGSNLDSSFNNDSHVSHVTERSSSSATTSDVDSTVIDDGASARRNNFIDDSKYQKTHNVAKTSGSASIVDDTKSNTLGLGTISGSSNQNQALSNEREIIIDHNLDNFNGKLTTEKGINLVIRGTSTPLNMISGDGKITSELSGKDSLIFDDQQGFTGELVADKGDIAVIGDSISSKPTYVVDHSNIILSSSSDDIVDLSTLNLRNNSDNNYFISIGNKHVDIDNRSARNVKNFVLADGNLNVKGDVQLDKVVNAGNINIGDNDLTMTNYDYQNGNGILELNVLPKSNPRIQINGASSDVDLKININSEEARQALKNQQVNLVKTSSGAKVSILNLDELNLGHNYKVVVSSSDDSNLVIESVVDDKVINLFHLMTASQIAAATPYSSFEFSNVVGGRFISASYADDKFKNLPNSDLTSYKNASTVSGYNFHFGKDVVNGKFHYNPIIEFRDLDIVTNTTVKNEGTTSSNAELMSVMLHNNFKYGSWVVRTDLGLDSLIYSGYERNYYLHTLNTGATFAYQPEFDLSHGITLALNGGIGGDYRPIIHQTLTKFAPHDIVNVKSLSPYRVFANAGMSISTKYFSLGLEGRFTYNAGSVQILSEHDQVKNELNSKYIWDANANANIFLNSHFSLNLLVNVNNQFRSTNTSTQIGLSYKW